MATTHITEDAVSEYEPGSFNAEASELGWPPGFIPGRLTTNLGNGQPFEFIHALTGEQGFVYRQGCGSATLVVYND